ncbi:S phase cyclin A-associated protein in the endoplasmic reticulum isoform X2 [Periplaneta americana]|uniref:S phase cyclin A-associated protein in the endoplasmic reticulum isoform X2 n=1 Tax=Periplaneta americana TaxID=6978 RepID=UPI0037E8AF5D
MEEVRLLVQEEGRAARNLIAFHVPVDHALSDSGKVVTRKPPASPRLQSEGKKEDGLRPSKRSCKSPKPGSRVRSASTGRDKKSELQARYWAFLFGNLQRAVDEIYQTCETDESVSECKEVILVLENYTRDFHNLIEWFKVKWEYENTPPPQRPTSLAWEVRKSSPGKIRPMSNMETTVTDDIAVAEQDSKSSSNSSPEIENLKRKTEILCTETRISDSLKTELAFNADPDNSTKQNDTQEDKTILNDAFSVANNNTATMDHVIPQNKLLNMSNVNKTAANIVSDEDASSHVTDNGYNQCINKPVKITTDKDTIVENKNVDVDYSLEIASNTEVSAKQSESLLNATVGSIILSTTTPETNNVCDTGDFNLKMEVEYDRNSTENEKNNNNEKSDTVDRTEATGKEKKIINCVSNDSEKLNDLEKSRICNGFVNNPLVQPDVPVVNSAEMVENEKKENQVENDHVKICEDEPEDIPVMVHQASQTDLEECVEDSDGIRFLSIPQKSVATVPAVVNKATPIANVANKTVTAGRSPVAPPRAGVRAVTVTPAIRPPLSAKPAYAAVSRLNSPISAKIQTQSSSTAPRTYSSPRLVRSRTSTDVRPPGRGSTIRKVEPVTAVFKTQRPALAARQCRPGGQQNGIVSSVAPKVESIPESGSTLDRRSGSNSSLNSSASSGARSWADKVKGTDVSQTTVSVEVLPRTGAGNEDDDMQGWETVKSRSRSRISPASKVEGLVSSLSRSAGNIKCRPLERKGSVSMASRPYAAKSRFQQPSAATSLPALALLEVEVRPPSITDGKKISEQKKSSSLTMTRRNNTNIAKLKKDVKDINEGNNKRLLKSIKSPVIQNKKISVVGKNEKQVKSEEHMNEKNVSKVTLISESIGSTKQGLEHLEKKRNMKSVDIKSKLIETQEEKLNRRNENADDIILDVQLEDILEEKSLFDEEELRKSKELCAEEEMLRKEIHELETTEIEVDTETDETETDGEATIGPEEDDDERQKELSESQRSLIPEDSLTLEARYETQLEGMSWAERVDALEQLEEMEARHPGRALELHQKLSSPSRRRTLPETLRCFQAKQAQAKEKRERLMQEKSQKLRELLNKVEEVKAAKAQLIEDKRVRLEMKLKRAEVNRKLHLKGIIRKAHDEEEKLKEIAFINELEAQNKRHDFMALCQEQEERLQGIQEERQRKQEEKAAKEAAVEERRRVLEAERQERLEKMQEMRRKREERVGRKQQEREKERQELAREKARDREERLSALHAAQLATQEELQKKIQQKQEESARRHEENIEHIRQRALESSILRCSTDDVAPRLAPYDTQKLCEVCNVLIGSEVYLLSHLRGRKHQEALQHQHEGVDPSREDLASYNIKHIVDAPADKIDPKIALDKERQKALKKRCKKIRLRMAARGQEYESKRDITNKIESPNKARIQKCLRDVEKQHISQGKGQWPNTAITSLERALGDINRILDRQNVLDQMAFQALNGFSTLSNILNLALDVPLNMAPYLPQKCFVTTCTTYNLACRNHAVNSKYVLFSNKVSTILDLLLHRLTVLIPDRNRMMSSSNSGGQGSLPVDTVAGALMRLLALVLNHAVTEDESSKDELSVRMQDVISYTVSVGVVDKLALYCGGVRDPIDGDPHAAQFLLSGLELLTTLAGRCNISVRRGGSNDDPTQLVATLQVTELVGAVSMLYGMLLHQGAPPRGSASPPPALPPHTIAVTIATIRLLSRVAELDLQMFQSVLGAEGISLQFRHIASYLLWYCSHDKEKELLHEVVRVVGFFAVRNHDNQMMIQSGYMPTVLQQLCNLPFPYFSNPTLSSLLFPTLLACCSGNHQNRAILEQEVSYQLLEEFKGSEVGKKNHLVLLLSGSSAA